MFAASVQEELYDADRWGQYYRPNGMRFEGAGANDDAAGTNAPVSKPVTAASIMDRAVAAKPATTTDSGWKDPAPAAPAGDKPVLNSPDAILAAIRARKLGGSAV